MDRETLFNYCSKYKNDIDKDLFNYGYKIFITYIKYLTIIIPISFLLETLPQQVLFLLFFIPLRRNIGGIHMANSKSCFFNSVVLAIIFPLIAVKIQETNMLFVIFIFMVTYVMTYKLGVIDHPNKRLSEKDKKYYLKKSLQLEVFYFMIAVLFYFTPWISIINLIVLIYLFFDCGMIFKKLFD